MLFQYISLVLLLYFKPMRMIPMSIYDNTWFNPTDLNYLLANLPSVTTLNMCACQCYNNSVCITGTYYNSNQTCVLFSASLSQGQLQLAINISANVFSFINRTLNDDVTNPPAIIEWRFDGNFDDVYGRYNGNPTYLNGTAGPNSSTLWMSPGYAGQGSAVSFTPAMYSLVDRYLDLSTTSFTVSAWVWVPSTFITSGYDYFALFSHCETTSNGKCLHIVVGNGRLRLGFYGDDLIGNSLLNLTQWYHVAYVYDEFALKQFVYLNGVIDASRNCSNPYTGNASQLVLGSIPLMKTVGIHSGFIDKLTFVSRVKNAGELLTEATLVAYYPFDGSYNDVGPNNMNNTTSVSTTTNSAGQFNQALLINSSYFSYFQTTGFYFLGQSNYSYSFSLWIYPSVTSGTILQIGTPSGWCAPMIGFNGQGYLTIQTLGSQGIYAASSSFSTLPTNQWTHICMTYSMTNGIRLYMGGSLTSSNNAYNDYAASGEMCTITIGTGLQPNACNTQKTQISSGQFQGRIDELKVFSRELSPSEILQLATA